MGKQSWLCVIHTWISWHCWLPLLSMQLEEEALCDTSFNKFKAVREGKGREVIFWKSTLLLCEFSESNAATDALLSILMACSHDFCYRGLFFIPKIAVAPFPFLFTEIQNSSAIVQVAVGLCLPWPVSYFLAHTKSRHHAPCLSQFSFYHLSVFSPLPFCLYIMEEDSFDHLTPPVCLASAQMLPGANIMGSRGDSWLSDNLNWGYQSSLHLIVLFHPVHCPRMDDTNVPSATLASSHSQTLRSSKRT